MIQVRVRLTNAYQIYWNTVRKNSFIDFEFHDKVHAKLKPIAGRTNNSVYTRIIMNLKAVRQL